MSIERPWEDEEDLYEYVEYGIHCMIVRHPHMGALCGYIGIPKGHPWYLKGYDDIDARVHGGLTFSGESIREYSKFPTNAWWIGFDCAHAGDLMPKVEELMAIQLIFPNGEFGNPDGVYKDVKFVKDEISKLVQQALTAKGQ
jgi:hypothetical protein